MSKAGRRGQPLGLILGRGRTASERQAMGFMASHAKPSDELIAYSGDGHALTIAPTGAGKGVSCIVPNALLYPGPLIVFDPKGEAYAIARRQRERLGQKVVLLDPFGTTGDKSDTLNPLDLAEVIDPGRPEDAATSLATLLTGGQLSLKDPFWDISATALLSGLVTWLLADCETEDRRFSSLYDLFAEADMMYEFARMIDCSKVKHPAAVAEFVAFMNFPERETRPSVLATARQHVPMFGSNAVRAATDTTSFDLKALINGKPVSLFIIVPPTKLLSHRPIVRLWLGALILALAARQRMPKKRTLMLIDEAGQLGPMAPLIQTATLLRGVGVTLWTFFQSPAQLEATYGKEAMVLADNAGVIQLFQPRNGRMAQAYANLLGDVTPDAVMGLEDTEQLLLLEGGRSVRAGRISYLDDPLCAGLFAPNPMFYRASGKKPRSCRSKKGDTSDPEIVGYFRWDDSPCRIIRDERNRNDFRAECYDYGDGWYPVSFADVMQTGIRISRAECDELIELEARLAKGWPW